ncbi:MAG: PilZ domain-containing protein [Planctomycetota bacterium]|jgi:hypothetical protein
MNDHPEPPEIQAGQDLREWTRRSSVLNSNLASLRFGPRKQVAGRVLDASPKGIGVEVEDGAQSQLEIGQRIEVFYKVARRQAVIRRIQPTLSGGYCIGVEFVGPG